jgi:hypothetical protein
LADKKHFNQFGRPITFEAYYALDYGPVASSALDLIKGEVITLRAAGIPGLPIQITKHDNIFTLDNPERASNRELFSRSDLRVFDEIVAEYGGKGFKELYDITHQGIVRHNSSA